MHPADDIVGVDHVAHPDQATEREDPLAQQTAGTMIGETDATTEIDVIGMVEMFETKIGKTMAVM